MEPNLVSTPAQQPASWRAFNDLTDDNLVALARDNKLAFEALMRRHNRRLFRVTRGVLRDSDAAQDAVQETYLRAFTKLDTYQPSGRFGAWISRVALNEALMMRRRNRGDTISIEDAGVDAVAAEEAAASDTPTADQFLEAAHARALLEHAIDALPENFRMVFMLRAVEGMDVRETADTLGVNSTTVRTRLFRAQRLLRAGLARRLHGESTEIFDFGAERCDHVVAYVLARLPS